MTATRNGRVDCGTLLLYLLAEKGEDIDLAPLDLTDLCISDVHRAQKYGIWG